MSPFDYSVPNTHFNTFLSQTTFLMSFPVPNFFFLTFFVSNHLSPPIQVCRHLIKVDLSKCKSLKKWAIAKIFYQCTKLEDVNVSYLGKEVVV